MIGAQDRLVFGPPGPFALWVFHLLQGLARCAKRPLQVVILDRLKDIPAPDFVAEQRILLCHFPSKAVVEGVPAHQGPILVISEDPNVIGGHLVRHTKRTAIEAVRVITAANVANNALRKEGITRVTGPTNLEVADLFKTLIQFLACDFEEGALRSFIAKETRDGWCESAVIETLRSLPKAEELDAGTDDFIWRMSQSILIPMLEVAHPDKTAQIRWPVDVFYLAAPEHPLASLETWVDLVGPTRCLYHGPYLHLPPAQYTVELIIEADDIWDEKRLRLDLLVGADLIGRFSFGLKSSGRFRAQFEGTVVDPIPEIQAQLIAERGSIDGRIRLESITFELANP